MACTMNHDGAGHPWDDITATKPPALRFSVVVVVTVLVGLLYLLIYAQLVAILCLRLWFMLVSYQTAFLMVNLLWASLRITLYTYYFESDDALVYQLHPFTHWLLVNLPTFLQFLSLALLVHYFLRIIFNGLEWKYGHTRWIFRCKRVANCVWFTILLVFLLLTGAIGIFIGDESGDATLKQNLIITRSIFTEVSFLLMAVVLSTCIFITYNTRFGRVLLQDQSTARKVWAVFVSLCLSVLFISRCIYNIATVYQGGWKLAAKWNLPSDQADYEWNSQYGFATYLIALIVWEVIPTYLVVFFFRVRLKWVTENSNNDTTSADLDVQSKFIFSNPKRYESVGDGSHNGSYQRSSSQVSIPQTAGYHNTTGASASGYSMNSSYQHIGVMPGTTPPRLFSAGKSPFSED